MIARKLKILLVDDDASIGQVLKAGLQMHGFTVRYEARSIDSLTACIEFHPDLVLLDVDMPFMDGGQVATELRNHPALCHTPVVFLTSLVTQQEAAQRNASSETILSKQIPIADLATALRAALRPTMPPEPGLQCRNPEASA